MNDRSWGTSHNFTRIEHPLTIERDINFQLNPKDNPEDTFFITKSQKKRCCGISCQVIHIPSKRVFAGKRIPLEYINTYQKKDLENQIMQLKYIISTYTTRVYGTFKKDNEIVILSEYCDRGSLRDILDYKQTVFSEDVIAVIMRDVIRGLILLHTKYNLTHNGIRASNILLSSNGFVKLTDIALDPLFYGTQSRNAFWYSPECLESSISNQASDVWSVGATAIELAEGSPPYIEFPLTNAVSKIVKFGFPGFRSDKHSPEFVDFVKKCMKNDPFERPKLTELMEHDFIKRAEKLPRKVVLHDLLNTRIKKILPPTKLYENIESTPQPFARSISTSHLFSSSMNLRANKRISPQRSSSRLSPIIMCREVNSSNDDLENEEKVSRDKDNPKYFILDEDTDSSQYVTSTPPPPLEDKEISDYIKSCKEMASQIKFIPMELSRFPPSDFSSMYSNMNENGDVDTNPIIKNAKLNIIALLKHKEAPKTVAWLYVVIAVYLGGFKGFVILAIISLLVFVLSSIIFPKLFLNDKRR